MGDSREKKKGLPGHCSHIKPKGLPGYCSHIKLKGLPGYSSHHPRDRCVNVEYHSAIIVRHCGADMSRFLMQLHSESHGSSANERPLITQSPCQSHMLSALRITTEAETGSAGATHHTS